jgi:hypothetical protein
LRIGWQRHAVSRFLLAVLACDLAAVAPAMALLLVPIAGVSAVGVEESEWYYFQRSMQHAADSAVIAAATNNNLTGSGSGYVAEAAGVARNFGYVDGANTTSVATAPAACPANSPAGVSCFTTTISTVVPLGFSGLIGFKGNAAYGSGRGELISASATATTTISGHNYCIWTQSSDSNSFTTNGAPNANLQGCSIMSNGGATCHGHDLGATYGDAHGTNSGCGITPSSNAAIPADPYKGLASNIPADSCSSYPQETTSHGQTTVAASNQLSGTKNWTGDHELCGDIQLTSNVKLTGSQTTITIKNGCLDTNGYTISTASGASATIVFSGTGSGYNHYPTGNGTIDIAAPSTGNWAGVAIYQDPATTSGIDFSYSGSDGCGGGTNWNISGLIYLPNANLTFSGAVNPASNGKSCFALVTSTILVNGTGNIFSGNTNCGSAGLTMASSVSARTRLVQ